MSIATRGLLNRKGPSTLRQKGPRVMHGIGLSVAGSITRWLPRGVSTMTSHPSGKLTVLVVRVPMVHGLSANIGSREAPHDEGHPHRAVTSECAAARLIPGVQLPSLGNSPLVGLDPDRNART